MATSINDIENLAKELDNKYPFSRYSTNYGQILREVASRTKVHDIIADISEIVFGISREPYYMSRYKPFLYGYMNELIGNLYEQRGKISMDSFCEAWINIREHENRKLIRERIEQIAVGRGLEVEKTKNDIQRTFEEFENNYKKLKQFTYNSNGYNQYLPLTKKGASLLLEYKFDPYGLPYGLGWSSNIFTEIESEKRKKEEEAKKQKEEERKRKSESKINTIATVVSVIIVLGVMIAIMAAGMENWFIALLFVLLWFKWLYK